MQLENILTTNEAATVEGVSRQTIYNWMKLGVLRYNQKRGTRLIDADDLKVASAIMESERKNYWLRKKNRKG